MRQHRVGVLRLVAGLISGSSALLSEAAHSAGDSSTEVLLLIGQRRSGSAPIVGTRTATARSATSGDARGDRDLRLGAGFAFWEGVTTIFDGGESSRTYFGINYPVLGLAAVFEGISWRQAAKRMRQDTKRTHRGVEQYLRTPRDPTVNSGPPAASWASRGHEADRPDQPRLEADETRSSSCREVLSARRQRRCQDAQQRQEGPDRRTSGT